MTASPHGSMSFPTFKAKNAQGFLGNHMDEDFVQVSPIRTERAIFELVVWVVVGGRASGATKSGLGGHRARAHGANLVGFVLQPLCGDFAPLVVWRSMWSVSPFAVRAAGNGTGSWARCGVGAAAPEREEAGHRWSRRARRSSGLLTEMRSGACKCRPTFFESGSS